MKVEQAISSFILQPLSLPNFPVLLNFFESDLATNYDLMRVKDAHIETIDPKREVEIVLMHGWHSLYRPMMTLENALREKIPHARIWRTTYDSHWKTFAQSAQQINGLLEKQGVAPQDTLLIGYSMGGVVCRSMVDNGFEARGLVSLCSPHLGAAPWMPAGDIGSWSIAPWSSRLRRLNASARDRARRGDYFFQAITFTDTTGYCRHDRIVAQRSALAYGLKGAMTRHTTKLDYKGMAHDCQPHIQGMNPNCLDEAFQWAAQKLA